MKKLTAGQIAVLVLATIPMIAVGGFGGWGTYTNIVSEFGRAATAAGAVAAGEGVTLVAALVMLVLTMLGQSSPSVVRVFLWLGPLAASAMGVAVADTLTERILYALTPLGMCGAAEGIGLLARRVVVYSTNVDVEAQRRNAAILRRIAYHRARAERHPWTWVRKRSTLKVWRLLSHAGDGDAQLGAGLMTVQRDRLTAGANDALGELLAGSPAQPELLPAQPVVSPEPVPVEPEPTTFETVAQTAIHVATPEPAPQPEPEPDRGWDIHHTLPDQHSSREPGFSPTEPTLVSRTEPSPEPEIDEQERQILELANRLRNGEPLTKTTAAEILAVSPATAGRRLKEARGRINEGTGFYP